MAWMVRDAVPADLEALVRIEGESQVTPWSEAAFRLYLREADDLVFLVAASAAFPGQALGFGLARLLQDTLEILNLAVTPAKRGRGLGRLLMEAMRERAGQAGCGTWILEVREKNREALALYRSLGFEESGRRAGYYKDTGETALLMTGSVDSQLEE